MFFTTEPFNMYSDPDDVEPKEEKAKVDEFGEKKEITMQDSLDKGGLYVSAAFSFVTYTGYNRLGNSATLALTKYLPKLIAEYPGVFVEADYSHPTRAVTDGLAVLPDIKFYTGAVYGGYLMNINEKTNAKVKLGMAYVSTPISSVALAYGGSIIRKLAIKQIELIGDITIKGGIWYVGGGVRYKIKTKK